AAEAGAHLEHQAARGLQPRGRGSRRDPIAQRVIPVGVVEVREPETGAEEQRALGLNLAAGDAGIERCGGAEEGGGRRGRRVQGEPILAQGGQGGPRRGSGETVGGAGSRENSGRGEPVEQPPQRPREARQEAASSAQLRRRERGVQQIEDTEPAAQVERGLDGVALDQLAAAMLRRVERIGRQALRGEERAGARIRRPAHAHRTPSCPGASVTREVRSTRPSAARASQRQRQTCASRRSRRARKRTRPPCRSTTRATSRYSAMTAPLPGKAGATILACPEQLQTRRPGFLAQRLGSRVSLVCRASFAGHGTTVARATIRFMLGLRIYTSFARSWSSVWRRRTRRNEPSSSRSTSGACG